jgi:hypothetical protein
MSGVDGLATEEVHRALDEFDRVFASGDANALAGLFGSTLT